MKSITSLVSRASGNLEHPFIARADGLMARIMLSFLATAGLFYVNIMPALVDGLIEGLGFSAKDAGLVASVNVYGSAIGALLAVFIIRHIPWKPLSAGLLLGIIAIDFFSGELTTPQSLIIARALHGVVGGILVGIGFAVIARTRHSDQSFGMLMLVQFGLGGLGLVMLPGLVSQYGIQVLFFSLIAFSVVTLLMLPFLAAYPQKDTQTNNQDQADNRKKWLMPSLVLLSIFCFQGALMGLFAYIFGFGVSLGLSRDLVAWVLGGASWMGMAGAFLMLILPQRLGRKIPLMVAMMAAVLAILALHFAQNKSVFIAASFAICICWSFVTPYLFGMCSEFDGAGAMAILGGFASKLGLATGPLLAAFILTDLDYSLLINVAIVGILSALILSIFPALILDKNTAAS